MNKLEFKNLNTKYMGKIVIHYEQIDSTQKEIWRQIEKGKIANGTMIIADIQNSGIGTHGRTWYTNEINNIAFSLALFPNCHIEKLNDLTLDIAQIFVEIFKDFYGIKLDIKLPNDLVIKGKKVGGILTETKIQGSTVKQLVIGVGINTNQKEFPEELKEIATSIKNEFRIDVNNFDVIKEFCNRLEGKIGGI